MKHFALSYDPVASVSVQKQLMAFLGESRTIYSWSKPFEGLVIIRTDASKEQLASMFRSFFDDQIQFFVLQADRENSFGNPHSRLSWDEARAVLPSCIAGKPLKSLLHVEPLTVFAASKVEEADWATILERLAS